MQERAYYNQGQKSHMYCMRILFSYEKALIVKVIKESLYFCKTEFISSFRNWIPFFIFISHTLYSAVALYVAASFLSGNHSFSHPYQNQFFPAHSSQQLLRFMGLWSQIALLLRAETKHALWQLKMIRMINFFMKFKNFYFSFPIAYSTK